MNTLHARRLALTATILLLGLAACDEEAAPRAADATGGEAPTASAQEEAREPGGHAHDADEAAPTLYTCPMHPQILQEEPGTCPICGMDLVPKRDTAGGASGSEAGGSGDAADDADLLTIDPVVVQNMGVRTAVVKRQDLSRKVRTVGTVQVAEDAVSVVNLRYSGWVEKIHVDETGVKVKRNDPLFEVYSPELLSAQEEYLLAVRTSGLQSSLARSARRRLELFGMADWQIKRLLNRGTPSARLTVVAPRTGYVIHKNVVEGARIEAGKDLYRIGDLSTVWIEAEVYEFDAPWIEVGAPAEVELTFQPGRTRDARVAYVYPTLDPQTRTLRVRLEMENPELDLKPGSFATVAIRSQHRSDVLVVPTESIIRSGTRELVFVAHALGKYEAREVDTGLSGDGYLTQVLDGVQAGERVVTSGQFLLDSESQLREAVQKMMERRLQAKAPGEEAGAPAIESGDHVHEAGETAQDTYWTCPMHPQIVQDEAGTCPICGMDLVERTR